MKLKHCPECLSRDLVFVLVWPDEAKCGRRGREPGEQLSPREVRACIRSRAASPGA